MEGFQEIKYVCNSGDYVIIFPAVIYRKELNQLAKLSEMDIASKISTMKIGMQGGFYPVPEEVEKDNIAEWQLRKSSVLGCTSLQVRYLPEDRTRLEELGKLAKSLDIELETSAPGVFQLTGSNADLKAKNQFLTPPVDNTAIILSKMISSKVLKYHLPLRGKSKYLVNDFTP
jgi:hypothetical protein